eukprot:CAMPEP_0171058710 /NCGR_PEP_ID=MMETSP0766_2-20121228/2680_1 /TAXON_ID=439317 /ORGANISM="Gambierdiscus australes, Strain CAWD 149" /LENGTH=114 /DNA_ID=CAMNT_0011514027 /DNA_START=63 /DNA_END=407 /DNA_ORIENTATION=-
MALRASGQPRRPRALRAAIAMAVAVGLALPLCWPNGASYVARPSVGGSPEMSARPAVAAAVSTVALSDLEVPDLGDVEVAPMVSNSDTKRTCLCDNGKRPCQCPSKQEKAHSDA